MDWSHLTAQDVGIIAAIATVASSIVAATAALVSTLVAGWNGRRLEAQTSLRAYRLQLLKPAIDYAEAKVRGVDLVRHHGQAPCAALYPAGHEPISRKVFVTPSDELQEASAAFAFVDLWCWKIFCDKGCPSLDEQEQEWLVDTLERAALTHREAVENFVFAQKFSSGLRASLTRERKSTNKRLKALLSTLETRRLVAPPGEKTPVQKAV
ncbi:MAG: hypothetical protein AB7H88_17750 [Vicinamibacterales bacterium]